VFSFLAITVLVLVILFNAGFPIFDPGITENDFTFMSIERKFTLPYPSEPYVNVSESQMNHCIILKTACQELIDNDQGSNYVKLNSSEYNCIASFLESLSPDNTDISWIYYLGFYFGITFAKG
jgi:hypothetical protein